MNPWFVAVNVLAIIIYLVCTLVIALASAALIWSLRNIDRTLAPAMSALVGMEKPLAKMVDSLDAVSSIASELKEIQEGDMQCIRAQVKAVNELRASVEEFSAALFAPKPVTPRRRGAGGTDESAEIIAEQRRKAGDNGEGPSLAEVLEQRGKHGGVV